MVKAFKLKSNATHQFREGQPETLGENILSVEARFLLALLKTNEERLVQPRMSCQIDERPLLFLP